MASLWPLDQVSNSFRLGEPRSPSLKFVAGAGFEPASSGLRSPLKCNAKPRGDRLKLDLWVNGKEVAGSTSRHPSPSFAVLRPRTSPASISSRYQQTCCRHRTQEPGFVVTHDPGSDEKSESSRRKHIWIP
jgi:hypothetical protein